jgi:hypothetical protein
MKKSIYTRVFWFDDVHDVFGVGIDEVRMP